MSNEGKWINYVGEIHTEQAKTKAGEDYTKRYILITKDFTIGFKNNIRLKKYSDNLLGLLEKEIITKEQYDKDMKRDISKKGTISYVLNVPPQKDFGEGPVIPIFKGYMNGVVEVKQDEKESIYIRANTTIELKKGMIIYLSDVEEKIKNSDATEEEKETQLRKYKIEGTDIMWLLYKGNLKVS